MISRTWSRKSIAFCIAVAVLSVYSMVALASPGQKGPSGELSVSGQVTVNGQAAISGATVFSDSVIATAANSSATVSLGKLGRVELLPNTAIKLSFSDANISGSLEAGRVQVSTLAGTSAIVTTKDAAAVSDAHQAATLWLTSSAGTPSSLPRAVLLIYGPVGTRRPWLLELLNLQVQHSPDRVVRA